MNCPQFFDRLEVYTERAKRIYPNRSTFNKAEMALISMKSPQTIYNNKKKYNFRSRKITIKEFVRMEMN